MKVYLAGAISGLDYFTGQGWRDVAMKELDWVGITAYSPLRGKQYLKEVGTIENAYDTVGDFKTPLSTEQGIMTRDYNDVRTSDAVLVNLKGLERVSIGTCIELGFAYAHRIPTVIVMEKTNIHQHPMVSQAGLVVETLDEGIDLIKQFLLP